LPVVRVQAKSFSLRDDNTPPVNPRARQIRFKSSTRFEPAANRIAPPARGSAGDPTLNGATLRVYNSAGSGELVTVTLPASGWVALGSVSRPLGYRFRASGAAVGTVTVRNDRISVSGGGESWGFTLNEASQGSVALRLTIGTLGVTWCAEAGRPPYQARYDVTDRFLGVTGTPAPAVCPAVP
jgi:hypothetical protein